jgi:tetratricopeptide (TPR) repeat protein
MPRALQPRPRRGPRRKPAQEGGLPRGVTEDIRRSARPGQAEEALARASRAVALLSRGDAAQAFREAERAKAAASRSGSVREILALAYYQAERWRDALREAQAYRRITGRKDQNHIIADCYRALGSPERAVPLAEEAMRAPIPEETRAEAAIVAASALAEMGRFDEALAMLRRLPARPNVGRAHDLRVWYVTGDVLARSGRREEAAREFRRIVRHDRNAFDAAERLAELST